MLRQKQLFRHEPENFQYGDCGRTAIACLLNMPVTDVPHFIGEWETREHIKRIGEEHPRCEEIAYIDMMRGSTEYSWQDATEMWLNEQGYTSMSIMFSAEAEDSLENLFHYMEARNPGRYYMLIGKSTRGTNHVVICCGGGFEWDPHPEGGFITAPIDGFYEVEFLLPLSMKHQS